MTGRSLLERARAVLEAPRTTRWLWLVPLLAAMPAVFTGYVLDDLQQQSMAKGTYDLAERGPADMYCFSLGRGRGIDPAILSWWDHPESSLCFLRPISSWTLWLDHTRLWSWPVLPHLHSILWFLALWFAWRALMLRYLPVRVANFALLLTATSGAVAMTTGWIASRHALVGGCLGIWGLYHCAVAREQSSRSGVTLRELFGWSLIALGLVSSEMVLGIFGFLVAREWLARDDAGARQSGAVPRILAYGLCGLAFVRTHARLGYGAPHYALYLNASGDPWTFLRAVPERLLALSGDLVLGVPSDLWVYTNFVPLLAVVALVAVLVLLHVVIALWPSLHETSLRSLRWMSLGGFLSMAPALSGMQGGRALTLVAFPAYALLGLYLLRGPTQDTADGRPRLSSLVWRVLAAGVLLGNPAAHFAWFGVLASLNQAGEKSLPDSQVSCPADSDVYMLDASELGAAAWYARYWLKDKLHARNYHQLTMSPLGTHEIRVVRTGPSTLTLRSSGGPLVGEMAIPPGSGEVFHVGMTQRYDDYSVVVKEVSPLGPVEIEVTFARSLSDPQLCLFVQDDAHLYQLKPPSMGEQETIDFVSPLQLMSRAGGMPPGAPLAASRAPALQTE